jgi:AraC-like DNA-binding protein
VYREWASRVPGAVAWCRPRRVDAAQFRVLPDGCMDLMWHEGELIVAGPDSRAVVLRNSPGKRYVALRFPPGVGPAVLGVPAVELCDRRVPLAALWPADAVRRAADTLERAGDTGAGAAGVVAGLEEIAFARLATRAPDPVARQIAVRIAAGWSVRAALADTAMSERQLRRRCTGAFGYGPKTLDRILRLQRVLALAGERTGSAAALAGGAALAADAGYADQAHLCREVKALAGVSLSELR